MDSELPIPITNKGTPYAQRALAHFVFSFRFRS